MRIRLDRAVRSSTEARWWFSLRACPSCGVIDDDIVGGKTEWSRTEWPAAGSGDWRDSGAYDIPCASCGYIRQILFFTIEQFWASFANVPGIAGPFPSQVIEPHEFADELLRLEALLPQDVTTAEGEIWKLAGHRWGRARSCVAELLKFLPPGADEIGTEHFWTSAGRAARAAHPERFRRAWIEPHEARIVILGDQLQAEIDRRHADGRDRYDPQETVKYLRKVGVPERIIGETMGSAAGAGVAPFSEASIEAHRRWLRDAVGAQRLEVHEAVAAEKQLSTLDLSGAILDRVVLDRADLSFTRLHGAKLTDVSARGASFANGMIAGTEITGCHFEGAGMPVANLGDAAITDSDFTGANLERTTWYRSKVTRCAFVGAAITDTGLDKAVFTDCDFRGADLGLVRELLGNSLDAEFIRCDLRDTNWLDRDLYRVRFVDCKLAGIRGIPIISETVFERSDLSAAGDGSQIATGREVLALWGIDPDNVRASMTKRTTYLFPAEERLRLDGELMQLGAAVTDESRFMDRDRGEMVNVTVREPRDAPFGPRFDEVLAAYRMSLVPPPTERDRRHLRLAQQIIDSSLDRGESFEQTINALMVAGFSRDEALEAMTSGDAST